MKIVSPGFGRHERGALAAVLMLSVAGTAGPASARHSDWKVIKDQKGMCQLLVPEDWQGMDGFGLAADPTGKASALVHTDDRSDWAQLKAAVKEKLKPNATIHDTADRYEFNFGPGGVHHYAARRFTGFTCVAQVNVQEGVAAGTFAGVAKKIVESLDKAR
jgi:hypothetical protein